MNIIIPDQHPGRCLNHRGQERCLEMDHHEGRCRFREPSPERPSHSQWVSSSYVSPKPTPWVVP